jgi:hypothetical protein
MSFVQDISQELILILQVKKVSTVYKTKYRHQESVPLLCVRITLDKMGLAYTDALMPLTIYFVDDIGRELRLILPA